MQQNLTEEQIQEKEELFFTILEQFIDDNFEVDPDYEMTEDDAYILSIVKEHFDENFRFPTLQESALEAITGWDVNEALYEEMALAILDETVGTFIAGARHGISHFLAKRKEAGATKSYDKAHAANKVAKTVASDTTKAHKTAVKQKTYGGGATGAFKSAVAGGKVQAKQNKAVKATAVLAKTKDKFHAASNKKAEVGAKRTGLANKIDTGIANVKNRVKSAITTGAQRIGGFLGRAMG
jgi:hypothetical protein